MTAILKAANSTSTVISVLRIQPENFGSTKARIVPLSIADTATVSFGSTTALWVFDSLAQHSSAPSTEPLSLANLITSLGKTLSFYPQFAGSLELTPYPQNGPENVPHTQRFRRSFVRYGTSEDPGVELQIEKMQGTTTADIFPNLESRRTTHKIWDLSDSESPLKAFSPDGILKGGIGTFERDLPAVKIKATYLEGGGSASVVIAIKIAHPLADAESMIRFMKDWGTMYTTSLLGQGPPATLSPIFDPGMLDAKASGDIDGSKPDTKIIEQSMALPLSRYDWWAHEKGRPARMDNNAQVTIPPEVPLQVAEARRRGKRIPWEEWDVGAAVTHKVFHITSQELQGIEEHIRSQTLGETKPISKHDVLVAFVWQLIAAAKSPETWSEAIGSDSGVGENDDIALCITLGLRPRLGLPPSFIGSPLLLTTLSAPHAKVVGTTQESNETENQTSTHSPFPNYPALSHIASCIRAHLNTFDRSSLGSWLHEQAFELAPQRWWNGFLGLRHTFVTSWIRSGVWDVDFGSETKLRWAGVIGPNLDGLTVVTEAEGGHGREWWQGGVDVDIKMEAKAMVKIEEVIAEWRRT